MKLYYRNVYRGDRRCRFIRGGYRLKSPRVLTGVRDPDMKFLGVETVSKADVIVFFEPAKS